MQPAKVPCGLATVAVDASDVALLYLSTHPRPPLAHQHRTDRFELLCRIPMVELQHHSIGDAAVDTGMRRKIRQHLTAVLDPSRVGLRDRAADVVRPVRQVMRVPIRGVAYPAVRIQQATSFV